MDATTKLDVKQEAAALLILQAKAVFLDDGDLAPDLAGERQVCSPGEEGVAAGFFAHLCVYSK